MRKLVDDGEIEKNSGKSYVVPEGLPNAGVVEVKEISGDGETVAYPVDWGKGGRPPKVFVITTKKRQMLVPQLWCVCLIIILAMLG